MQKVITISSHMWNHSSASVYSLVELLGNGITALMGS